MKFLIIAFIAISALAKAETNEVCVQQMLTKGYSGEAAVDLCQPGTHMACVRDMYTKGYSGMVATTLCPQDSADEESDLTPAKPSPALVDQCRAYVKNQSGAVSSFSGKTQALAAKFCAATGASVSACNAHVTCREPLLYGFEKTKSRREIKGNVSLNLDGSITISNPKTVVQGQIMSLSILSSSEVCVFMSGRYIGSEEADALKADGPLAALNSDGSVRGLVTDSSSGRLTTVTCGK